VTDSVSTDLTEVEDSYVLNGVSASHERIIPS
jgi:hypothetical protein